ncbi:DEAD/DEAH box helicase [Sphingomonas astaxanthinifaciens]|uniref:RNA helicase n=1 Tax=Sphingomonas astaxanthinifaciens DSM 22298 TaxID=1123267 RepID=A0ABQ5Z7Y5_9SPHN|nr:DEAD/DEAH box helicase [Sphingomonas astaxanthinifaciens]GLR46687.1 RNA helicase [Sphingomonas astaxanthinifaciens DSM 22298]
MTTTFEQLGLSTPLLKALAAKNYTQPSPIQAQAIPHVLEGRDLLGIAQTGTGKTAAFMAPSLQRLAANRPAFLKPGQIRMLVLAPTRELASQIAASAEAYGAGLKTTVGVIFGGVANAKSIRTVSRGLDVLVATPGRLLDLVDQRALSLANLEILVLDEADQMLDLGFIHALKRIVKLIPAKRQTLFFSATMPKTIKSLADEYLKNPAEVAVTPVATTAERVEQFVTFVNQAEKTALLTLFFQNGKDIERTLVFSRTKHGADKIVRMLAAAGIAANAIHGNKSQPQRERALDAFRDGSVPILVATDIAARGIDIPGVSHVVNYDLPNVPEQYVHRIGRTARAGADGIAIAYCDREERPFLKDIEKLTRQKLTEVALPQGFMQAVEAMKRLKPEPKRAPQQNQRNRRNESGARGHARDPQRHGLPRNDPRADMPEDRNGPREGGRSMRGVPGAVRGPVGNPVRPGGQGQQQQGQRHGGQRPAGQPGGGRPGGGQRRRGPSGGGQRRAG